MMLVLDMPKPLSELNFKNSIQETDAQEESQRFSIFTCCGHSDNGAIVVWVSRQYT